MRLSADERIRLLAVLPSHADIGTIRTTHKLRMLLDLTPVEMQTIELTQDGPEINWNGDIAVNLVTEISLDGEMKALIVTQLKDLNTGKKLNEQHLTLWEKFVEATEGN